MGVASLVLGILAVLIGIFSSGVLGWLGAIMAIIGVVMGALGMKKPESKGIATAGLVLSIVGLAMIGSIKDEILNTDELALNLIRFLMEHYPGRLTERYGCEETAQEALTVYEEIARRRGCIKKGQELDYTKTGMLLFPRGPSVLPGQSSQPQDCARICFLPDRSQSP